ncbi:MAG: HAMP domain-containing protein [bacterium]
MEHGHQKRRYINISIKKDLQLRIFSWIGLIVLISVFVSGGIFYHYSNRKIDTTYKQFHIQLSNMRQALAPWIFLAIGLGTLAALGAALFYPKKIAGPLFRLEKRLQRIASGDLKEQVQLRSNDELQDLAREINQMGVKLRERLLSARETVYTLDATIHEGMAKAFSEDLTRKLKNESATLKKMFDEFVL